VYKLLVVDDEPSILDGIKRTLPWKDYGFGEVQTATKMREAISKAVEMNPDLAVFDVCLGSDRSYNAINELAKYGLKTVYLMLSGHESFEFAREAIRCGAKDYILKPVDSESFKKRVEKIIVEDFHGSVIKKEECQDPILGHDWNEFSTLTQRILKITMAEYRENLNLKIVSDKFKMNSVYIGQIFLKETGIKYSEYLMRYRMLKAREKIICTEDKIAAIANEVGYSNLNYFYLHFKARFNMSPTDLRAPK
jgi:YesN/AraC family two-component response regulator